MADGGNEFGVSLLKLLLAIHVAKHDQGPAWRHVLPPILVAAGHPQFRRAGAVPVSASLLIDDFHVVGATARALAVAGACQQVDQLLAADQPGDGPPLGGFGVEVEQRFGGRVGHQQLVEVVDGEDRLRQGREDREDLLVLTGGALAADGHRGALVLEVLQAPAMRQERLANLPGQRRPRIGRRQRHHLGLGRVVR